MKEKVWNAQSRRIIEKLNFHKCESMELVQIPALQEHSTVLSDMERTFRKPK